MQTFGFCILAFYFGTIAGLSLAEKTTPKPTSGIYTAEYVQSSRKWYYLMGCIDFVVDHNKSKGSDYCLKKFEAFK